MHTAIRSWLPWILIAALCAVALSWRAGASGSAVAAAPQTSVAVVNVERLVRALTELEEHRARIDREAIRLEGEFERRTQTLRDLLQQRGELSSQSEAWREKTLEGLRLEVTTNAEVEVHRNWIAMEQGRVYKQMFYKIESTVETIATRDGWDVVLWDHSDSPALSMETDPESDRFESVARRVLGRTVAYSSPRVDITQLIIDTMNNAYAAAR